MSKTSCKCEFPCTEYSHKWDAYYCIVCNQWLESKCGCEKGKYKCWYDCKNRPEKPIEIKK